MNTLFSLRLFFLVCFQFTCQLGWYSYLILTRATSRVASRSVVLPHSFSHHLNFWLARALYVSLSLLSVAGVLVSVLSCSSLCFRSGGLLHA